MSESVRDEKILIVAAVLGERVHPVTGRLLVYVACDPVEGEAQVCDDEIAELTWATTRDQLTTYMATDFFPPFTTTSKPRCKGRQGGHRAV